jgi:hypothetical protein
MKPNGPASDAKVQTEASIEHWQQRCAELTAERDRLRQQLAELREKYEPVLESLVILMGMDEEVDFEALRAQIGKGPSAREFLEELEKEFNLKGAS